MIAHLFVATASVLISQGFDPQFPILSLAGEFVLKNLVLIAGPIAFFLMPPKAKFVKVYIKF